MAKSFDKVSFLQHLGDGIRARTPLSTPSMAGRPTPTFAKAEEQDLSGTIPWQIPNQSSGEEKEKSATASSLGHAELQQAVVSHAVEVAHHLHHHLHHQPPPTAQYHSYPAPCLAPPAQMVYPDNCVHAVYREESCRAPPAASIRTRACLDGQAAASPASRHQQPAELDSSQEEERFNAGLKRMVTRAELHRADSKRRHHRH